MRSVAAFVLLGVLAGCSGTPKPGVSPSPTDDAGRARLLVLTQTDLPDGWRSSKHKTDAVAAREDKKLAACIGAPDPATSQTTDVFGDVFGQGAQTITEYESLAQLEAALRAAGYLDDGRRTTDDGR